MQREKQDRFKTKIWKSGSSRVITVRNDILKYGNNNNGYKEGEIVEIIIKKAK